MKTLLSLLLLIPLSLVASSQPGTTGGDILLMGASARAIAMGEAFSYISDDASAMLYNPSSLSRLRTLQLSVLYQEHLADITYDTVNIGIPLKHGSIGISLQAIIYPDIYENTVESGSIIEKTKLDNINDYVFTAGYGQRIWNNLDAGINLKYYKSSLVDYSGSAFLTDIGLTYSLRSYSIPSGDFHFAKEIKAYRDLEIHYTKKEYKNKADISTKNIDEKIKNLDNSIKQLNKKTEKTKDDKTKAELEKAQIKKQGLLNEKNKRVKKIFQEKDKRLRELAQYYAIVFEDFHTAQKLKKLSNEGEKIRFMKEVKLRKAERYFNNLINDYNNQLINMETDINEQIKEINSEIDTHADSIKRLSEQRKKYTDKLTKKVSTNQKKASKKEENIQVNLKDNPKLKEIDQDIKEKEKSVQQLEKRKINLANKLGREIKKIEKTIHQQELLSQNEKKRIEDMFKKSLQDKKIEQQVRNDIEQKYELEKLKNIDELSKTINDKIEKWTKQRDSLFIEQEQSLRLIKIKKNNLLNSANKEKETEIKKIEQECDKIDKLYKNQIKEMNEKINNLQNNIHHEKKIVLIDNFNNLLKELVDSNVAEDEEKRLYYQQEQETGKLFNKYSKPLTQIEVNKRLGRTNPKKLLHQAKEYQSKLLQIKKNYYNYAISKKFKEGEDDIIKLREASLKKMRDELKEKLHKMDNTLDSQEEDIYLERLSFERQREIDTVKSKYKNNITELEKKISQKNLKKDEEEKTIKNLDLLFSKQENEIEKKTEKYQEKINDYHRNILRKGNNIFITASLRNLGTSIKYDQEEVPLPLTLQGGVGAYIIPNLSLGTEIVREMYEERTSVNIGSEYKFLNLFPLRAGYQIGKDDSGLTLGTGIDTIIRLGLTRFNISIGYTYIPYSTFSDQHTIGLTIKKL